MQDVCSLRKFKCPCGDGGWRGGEDLGGFLGNSAVCAGKQMLPTIATVEKKLMLYSDSIHGSPKPKLPESDVIAQEALLQRQTQTRALRCADGGGAM